MKLYSFISVSSARIPVNPSFSIAVLLTMSNDVTGHILAEFLLMKLCLTLTQELCGDFLDCMFTLPLVPPVNASLT